MEWEDENDVPSEYMAPAWMSFWRKQIHKRQEQCVFFFLRERTLMILEEKTKKTKLAMLASGYQRL